MISSSTKDCFDADVTLTNKQEFVTNLKSKINQAVNPSKTQVYNFADSVVKDQECLNALKFNKNFEEIKPETIKIKLDLTNIENEGHHICRICLGNDQVSNLISPCTCTGSQKYVHEECLKTWLLNKKEEDLGYCEVCKNIFKTNFKVMSICLR